MPSAAAARLRSPDQERSTTANRLAEAAANIADPMDIAGPDIAGPMSIADPTIGNRAAANIARSPRVQPVAAYRAAANIAGPAAQSRIADSAGPGPYSARPPALAAFAAIA